MLWGPSLIHQLKICSKNSKKITTNRTKIEINSKVGDFNSSWNASWSHRQIHLDILK